MKERKVQTTELRSCVKVELAVLGSPSLVVFPVSVDVKQHWTELRSSGLSVRAVGLYEYWVI